MLLSIAIVTGFKNEISEKVAGFNSQIVITPTKIGMSEGADSTEFLKLDNATRTLLSKHLPLMLISRCHYNAR